MKALLLTTVGFLVTSIVLIALTRWAGAQSQPTVRFEQIFTDKSGVPCQMPCMFGIELSKTKFDDAVTILKDHPLTAGISDPETTNANSPTFRYLTNACLAVGLDVDGYNVVNHIQLEARPNEQNEQCAVSLSAETLGNTISVLGRPDSVIIGLFGDKDTAINYKANHLVLLYTQLSYLSRDYRLQSDDPYWWLIMDKNFDPGSLNSDWLGFTKIQKYELHTH